MSLRMRVALSSMTRIVSSVLARGRAVSEMIRAPSRLMLTVLATLKPPFSRKRKGVETL
jgi:hypothetical protein